NGNRYRRVQGALGNFSSPGGQAVKVAAVIEACLGARGPGTVSKQPVKGNIGTRNAVEIDVEDHACRGRAAAADPETRARSVGERRGGGDVGDGEGAVVAGYARSRD